MLLLSTAGFAPISWAASNQQEFRTEAPLPQVSTPTNPGTAPDRYIQLDVSTYSAWELDELANQAYRDGDYDQAVQYQYWAIQNGDDSYYDLACDYALAGNVEAAIHWLYIDAQKGTADVNWTDNDPDLANVRNHGDWPALREYLVAMEQYWAESGNRAYKAIVPENYQPQTLIPLIVALHGKGDSPLEFIHDGYQRLADDLNIAIVSISGPIPYGQNAYKWSTDPHENDAHLQDFLPEILKREDIAASKMALLGFSQGAQVSLQTIAFHPDQWQGALAMSPGLYPVQDVIFSGTTVPDLSQVNIIVTNGAEENEYYLNLAGQNINILKFGDANIQHLVYPNQGHQFPSDYYENITNWVNTILSSGT